MLAIIQGSVEPESHLLLPGRPKSAAVERFFPATRPYAKLFAGRREASTNHIGIRTTAALPFTEARIVVSAAAGLP